MDSLDQKGSIQLPAELWSTIIGDVTHRAPELIQLASVCRLWRHSIQQYPTLWTHIICEKHNDLEQQQLELQLQLSAGLALTVTIVTDGDTWPVHQHFIRSVLCEHRRIKSLSLHFGLFRDWQFSSVLQEVVGRLIDGSEWPLLAGIDLKILPVFRHTYPPVSLIAPNLINISVVHWRVHDWQRLASSGLRSMTVQDNEDEPAALSMAPYPNIEVLKIQKRQAVFTRAVTTQLLWARLTSASLTCVTMEMEDLDAFLQCCPSLISLTVHIDVPPETVEHLLQCVPTTLRHLSLSVNGHFRLNPLFPNDRLRMLESLRVVTAFILQPSSILGSNIQVFDANGIYMHLTDLATAFVSGTLNMLRILRLRDIKRTSLLDDGGPWGHVLGAIAGPTPLLPSLEEMDIEFSPGAAEGYPIDPRAPHVDFVNFIAVLVAVFANPSCRVRSAILKPLLLRLPQIEAIFRGVDFEAGNSRVTMINASPATLKHVFFSGEKAGAPLRIGILVDIAELEAVHNRNDGTVNENGILGKLMPLLRTTL